MIRIAITPETLGDIKREAAAVRSLLEAGWDRAHLRHPGASRSDMQRLIEAIPQELHGRLVLHGHFDLCNFFNLGGLHLNRRCPSPPPLYRGALSRSCHTVGEVMASEGMAYVTLSPVFDSISKQGYLSGFSPDDFAALADAPVPVIALGGVTPERIAQLGGMNFSGFAMLGSIPWDESPENIKKFAKTI